MICAYHKVYLEKARTKLGRMLDFATYDLGYDPCEFFGLFMNCGLAERFGKGELTLTVGMSGVELAYRALELTKHQVEFPTQQTAVRSIGRAGRWPTISGKPQCPSLRFWNTFRWMTSFVCTLPITKWISAISVTG